MSHLAGWYGINETNGNALAAMVGALEALSPVVEETAGETFAAGTIQPGMAGRINRIAASDDGKVTVAFAGYLYDTDVDIAINPARHCLELYEKSGSRFACDLNGSFAVAVIDERLGQLHLVTDRLGSVPVYYAEGPPFLFATGMRAIQAFPGFSAEVNPDRLMEHLILSAVPGHVTYFDRIRMVPSGTVLTWDGRKSRLEHYWSPVFTWHENTSADECGDNIARAMQAAMRRICARSDRCALMLSGGLDSRTIAAASPVPLQCMTMHLAEDALEVMTARRVARTLGHSHRFVELPNTYPLELLETGTLLSDGMKAFHHSQAIYLRDVLVETEAEIVLNGQLLDVLFSGACLPLMRRRGMARFAPPRLQPASQIACGADTWISFLMAAPVKVLRKLCRSEPADTIAAVRERLVSIEERLCSDGRCVYDAANTVLLHIFSSHVSLPNDQSIEYLTGSAFPAFDNEVIDAYLTVPPFLRFNHIAYRRAIARLNPDVAGIPYTRTGVPITLHPVLERCGGIAVRHGRAAVRSLRRLCGLSVPPAGEWPKIGESMTRCPEWHKVLRERADSSQMVELGLIDRDALHDIVEAQIAGRADHKELLGGWLTLEVWLEQREQGSSATAGCLPATDRRERTVPMISEGTS
ncbi:MAG: hypothetical protein J7M38_16025 [Armatimonadetes bacterium]|nr:hypothetical protein [Armatimonadota bacterium]